VARAHRDHVSRHQYRRDNDHWSFSLFAGGNRWGLGFGFNNHSYFNYGNSFAFRLGFGGGRWYSNSYLHGAGFRPNWYSHYWGNPFFRGAGFNAGFGRFSRFHFGYSHFYPFATYTPYPFYRWGLYEPFYVNAFASALPVYRTFYYVNRPVVRGFTSEVVYYDDFVEACDPYVESDVVIGVDEIDALGYESAAVPASVALAPVAGGGTSIAGLPPELNAPLVSDFPRGLSFDEYLAYGEEALYNADYVSAAEAFRQATLQKPADDYARFQLATALFGAERFALAGQVVESALALNPAWLHRRFDVGDVFSDRAEFDRRVRALETHLVTQDTDAYGRFMLAYVYYYSGNLFGSRNLLRVLEERAVEIEGIDGMAREAEHRLTRSDREGR
jgi:hypothetical protein